MKKIFSALALVLLVGAVVLLFSADHLAVERSLRKVHKTWGLECRKVAESCD
jgi:hypothetical protein